MNDPRPRYPGRDLEAMSFAVNYHRWIVAACEPYLGERVAEVGAGIGSVSRLLLKTGIKRLTAFEPSMNVFPLLAEELRREERATAVNDFFGPRSTEEGFDSVVYLNVLEHIPDDRGELAHAREALKPEGHLLLFVPALTWLYSDLDKRIGHVRRYTKRGLAGLVRDAGLSVVKACYFDCAGIFPWYVNCVLLRNSTVAGSVVLYDRFVIPTMRLLETAVAPPLGKNVLVVGRKI